MYICPLSLLTRTRTTIMSRKPVIAITADYMMVRDILPAAVVYNVYSDAVIRAADALPWIFPPVGEAMDYDGMLDRIDGIVFTGARSNIQPHRYQGEAAPENTVQDPHRDATTLSLIPKVIDAGIPMLCICRGIQELNVALGGTLHQDVPGLPGKLNHFPPEDWSIERRFAHSHEVQLEAGSDLAKLTAMKTVTVNSVHEQGIDRLAGNLIIEARAPDGIIEAVRVRDSKAFAAGVQWHPEWDWRSHSLNAKIWAAFGAACRGLP